MLEGIPVDGIDTWLMPGERHSIAGRVRWFDGVTAENVVIEHANLTAKRTGGSFRNLVTCSGSPASHAAPSSCSHAPTRTAARSPA